ncbi:MAG: hypothetical protein IAG13_01675 [Deltaproteobacteria bacterium]|nr:hypothetical protein [Nannocystaceae bacterium]
MWPPTEEQVRTNIAGAFERLSAGDYIEHVDLAFSPEGELVIHGPPDVVPGDFVGSDAIKQGFAALFESVPVHDFVLHEIWVTTTPEVVTAAVVWTDAAERSDGSALPSQGMNYIQLGETGVIKEDIFITLDP